MEKNLKRIQIIKNHLLTGLDGNPITTNQTKSREDKKNFNLQFKYSKEVSFALKNNLPIVALGFSFLLHSLIFL